MLLPRGPAQDSSASQRSFDTYKLMHDFFNFAHFHDMEALQKRILLPMKGAL